MKDEDDPITDDEFLLHRVHKDRFYPILSPNAFEPRIKGQDIDSDGISLYREACLTDGNDVLAPISEVKRSFIGVVRLPVAFVKSLGLTVSKSPAAPIRGHVVIPELNVTAYQADKARFTPIKKKLAEEAGKDENIVRRPGPPPGAT